MSSLILEHLSQGPVVLKNIIISHFSSVIQIMNSKYHYLIKNQITMHQRALAGGKKSPLQKRAGLGFDQIREQDHQEHSKNLVVKEEKYLIVHASMREDMSMHHWHSTVTQQRLNNF